MRSIIAITLACALAAVTLGCPPEGAKKDDHDHKPGDGHDHGKDAPKK